MFVNNRCGEAAEDPDHLMRYTDVFATYTCRETGYFPLINVDHRKVLDVGLRFRIHYNMISIEWHLIPWQGLGS